MIGYYFTEIDWITFILKTIFINMCTYYTYVRALNRKQNYVYKLIVVFVLNIVISGIYTYIKIEYNHYIGIIISVILQALIYCIMEKQNFMQSLIITGICLGINYILLATSVTIGFIPSTILKIENDYANLVIICSIYIVMLNILFRINKIKNGFIFLQSSLENDYLSLTILNISVSIIFTLLILNNVHLLVDKSANLAASVVMFIIIMFITIQKTFTMYYKHKLLVSDLEETKAELESKKKEIERLEAENLEFSKTSHTISHQIKSLKFKIKELEMSKEISNEIDISNRVQEISDEYYRKTAIVNIDKTGITEIDDMLNYMQSECINNDIEFELQLNGSIHYMVNNIIPKEKLEILLADHIKDAIIAVNHSDNINKSILVRLGLLDGVYSIYVYDSGIEFEEKTLAKLGKEPITTHKNEGGTGMGFMNTFDTLKKYNASMIINEIGKPSKDNYTKVIIIKFDNKNEFKIQSYKENIV